MASLQAAKGSWTFHIRCFRLLAQNLPTQFDDLRRKFFRLKWRTSFCASTFYRILVIPAGSCFCFSQSFAILQHKISLNNVSRLSEMKATVLLNQLLTVWDRTDFLINFHTVCLHKARVKTRADRWLSWISNNRKSSCMRWKSDVCC